MPQIVILDFGSQSTHLIARRLKDLGYSAEIFPSHTTAEDVKKLAPKGLIFSGSPDSVYENTAQRFDPALLQLNIPKLGICYGFQCVVHHLGGSVEPCTVREFGDCPVSVSQNNPLFDGLGQNFTAWMSHGDSITMLPKGFQLFASSQNHPSAAVCPELNFWGLQFHPELAHTQSGKEILQNFAAKICGLPPLAQSMEEHLNKIRARITQQAGDSPVLLLISGGVDSSVAAAVLLKCLPSEKIHLMYIDTGLMRKDETTEIKQILSKLNATHVHVVEAQQQFLTALAGEGDPEGKRKIIGNMFVTVMEEAVQSLNLPKDYYLAQGTLYTDLIESGKGVGKSSHLIKSHHNVNAPFIQEKRASGMLIEPLNELYKDEVRALGLYLGLPENLVHRHPFPGPGLGVRVVGEIDPEKVRVLQEADAIFIEELHKRGLYEQIWQAFAVLIPAKSVGVAGDVRRYGWTIGLRAVSSIDGISADVFDFPLKDLKEISARITNEIHEVARVVYDISSKPPATIEWE
ncbi:MAG: glutamine-hydrolyzing GMP synthase [Brevinema sp.]